MKKYKQSIPQETIFKIRTILHELGIILYEKHIVQDDLYSCRVAIGNDNLLNLNIGTNGKGRSFEYSLASGCAEFMERLQNRLILNVTKTQITDKTFSIISWGDAGTAPYVYSKDEIKIQPPYDLGETLDKSLSYLCSSKGCLCWSISSLDKAFPKEMTLVPFYDVKNQIEIQLPIEFLLLMTGSNGMASGNSYKEAILQAICEIFERYAISEIYWKNLTPPTIPLEEFHGSEIYNKITKYKKKHPNYQLIIKDCSLGKGIPAIGLLIIDSVNKYYNFKLGVDFVPEIALERCFTEIHQGTTEFHRLDFKFIKTEDDIDESENNLLNIFINGSGYWPKSIVLDKPSYPFVGFNPNLGLSNKQDLDYSISLINNLGYNIYIRNNSSLGFPTFYVVIPGMSQILQKDVLKLSSYGSFFHDLKLINCLGSINEDIAYRLLLAIDENYDQLKKRNVSLKKMMVSNINNDLNQLSFEMLAALLALYLDRKETFIKYMTIYLQDKDEYLFKYYYACLEYIKLLVEDNEPNNAKRILELFYGKELANEVIHDLSNPKVVFQYYKMSNCPDCNNCSLYNDCRKRHITDLQQRIYKKEEQISIIQNDTKKILESYED